MIHVAARASDGVNVRFAEVHEVRYIDAMEDPKDSDAPKTSRWRRWGRYLLEGLLRLHNHGIYDFF